MNDPSLKQSIQSSYEAATLTLNAKLPNVAKGKDRGILAAFRRELEHDEEEEEVSTRARILERSVPPTDASQTVVVHVDCVYPSRRHIRATGECPIHMHAPTPLEAVHGGWKRNI